MNKTDEERPWRFQHMSAGDTVKAALADAFQLTVLVSELCEAVDNEADDIGTGPRTSGAIIREIGPIVQPTQRNIREALNVIKSALDHDLLRDRFAGQALAAIVGVIPEGGLWEAAAMDAYAIADAMLAERAKGSGS